MRFSATSVSTISVLLLAKDVLAAAHGRRHADYHRNLILRDMVTVTNDIWVTVTMDIIDTITDTCYVTVTWGEPAATAATAAVVVTDVVPVVPVATTSAAAVVKPVATSTPSAAPVPPTTSSDPPPAATSTTLASEAEFLEKTSTTAPAVPTTPAAAPTTMATVVKPTTAAASTPSVVAPPVVAAVSGGKRGVAFNDPAFTMPFTSGQVSWAYNWDSSPSGTIRSGLEYVPLLWGMANEHTSVWSARASSAIASGSTHLLGFNEPDLGSQSNMDVNTAVGGWKQYMEPFAGKALLISPAVTNGGGAMGLAYLQSFVQSCTGCNIHCVAIHWYDSATNLGYFKDHITQANTMTGKCVWVTEWAGSGTPAEQATFIQEATAWMDSQPFIERYSYFMASQGSLISGSGLSSIGTAYNS